MAVENQRISHSEDRTSQGNHELEDDATALEVERKLALEGEFFSLLGREGASFSVAMCQCSTSRIRKCRSYGSGVLWLQ